MKGKQEVEISESGFLALKDKEEQKKKQELPEKNISDKILIISIALLMLALVFFISLKFFTKETPRTIEDLHKLNLQGKLDPKEGYVHNGYSFVYFDGLWYTQVQRGNNLFNIPLHYGPNELGDIPIIGQINSTLFNKQKEVYYTFNPIAYDLRYVKLSVWEFTNTIISAFNKIPKPACDKNETEACENVPILTCENKNVPIVYFKQESTTSVIYNDNCIIVQGNDKEIVMATDRMLLNLYGIMG